LQIVERPQSEGELQALRRSAQRGSPYGTARWQKNTAVRLGLEFTLRPRGRPRKSS
jgi:putative transposase